MNIESICTSLELSKKLHELGVRKKSLFSWYERFLANGLGGYLISEKITNEVQGPNRYTYQYQAFTAEELLEITIRATGEFTIEMTEYMKLADGVANTLIGLIENEQIKVEDINKL